MPNEIIEQEAIAVRTETLPARIRERSASEQAIWNVGKLVEQGAAIDAIERFIGLQERILAMQAKAASDQAFASMQAELPEVAKDGHVYDKHGALRYKFAKFEDAIAAIRPVMARFGFAPTFQTEYLSGEWQGWMEVTCILSHANGHERRSSFRVQPDREAYMSATQQEGAARSYGKRYALLDVMGLATRDEDNDAVGEPKDPAESRQRETSQPSGRSGYSSRGDTRPITDKQLTRAVAICSKSGRSPEVIKAWAFGRYGVKSRKDLNREQYDDFCSAIEASGDLPSGVFGEREPGSDDE
jgi:hypothetical protein